MESTSRSNRPANVRFASRHSVRFALVLVLLTGFGIQAKAQQVALQVGKISSTIAAFDLEATRLPAGSIAAPAGNSRSEWKVVKKQQIVALKGADFNERARALQSIIYFATYHPEEVSFRNTAPRIYSIYKDDPDDGMRVLALSALLAMGADEALRFVAQDVKTERSERVRRVTTLALAERFGYRNR